jgi:cytochrome c556
MLGALAFSIDQDRTKRTGKDVLILAPRLNSAVEVDTYVTVLGEVVRFDPDEIARKTKDYKVDLNAEALERYRGRPAVLATAVLNAAMVDLAKRLPPPMTPQEEAYDKIMKRVGPSFAALRQAMGDSSMEKSRKETDVLKQAFGEAEAFWKTRARTDAVQWARDARKQVDAIERAAAIGKWDDVKTSIGALGQACQSCHGAYRERFDDGTFRIKSGATQ